MDYPSSEVRDLFQKARSYDQKRDVYNAVKLYKRIIKIAPEWRPPYARLGEMYKHREEWKAALHYNKKTVALDSSDKKAWWNLGIAATALNRRRIAQNVWNKFGVGATQPNPCCIRLSYNEQFEILWIRPISPAKGIITNIPYPAADRRYRDIILFDGKISGYNVVNQKRFPVYEELGVFKRSVFTTWSCNLIKVNQEDIQLLERLCQNAKIGFEVWSNATRVFSPFEKSQLPEYYGSDLINSGTDSDVMVAMAAKRKQDLIEVLTSWQVISLKSYNDLSYYS